MISDIDGCIQKLLKVELLSEAEVEFICNKSIEILADEDNVLKLSAPIKVVGDIHGQFHDLLELFTSGGYPPDSRYLFLGDLVDRGAYGLECLLLLLAYKIKYPTKMFILRGNHESRQLNLTYGFYEECFNKYGSIIVWKMCTSVFDVLPMAGVIDSQIYCVHGGLSPKLDTYSKIAEQDRKLEIEIENHLSDLMWSDPVVSVDEFKPSIRGAGYYFGENAVKKFLETNKCDVIVRSHQMKNGHEELFNKTLVTIWSAPNYLHRDSNTAAFMTVDNQLRIDFVYFDPASVTKPELKPQRQIVDYFL